MLKLRRLIVEDFGPFKGEQFIDFPDENGITIIYGENMRGKTSLLNAIRYVLFGKVRDRGYRDAPLLQISNWESVAEGKYGFKVSLQFGYDGKNYELIRSCSPRPHLLFAPESDQDYIEECFLRCEGDVLSPEQRDHELNRIMPEQVSRFFLFDGELLQEYEELLRSESDMGKKITEAIERILGVPILTNGRSHLRELLQNAQRQESKAAQKDQKTRVLGTMQEDLFVKRAAFEQEVEQKIEELERCKGKKVNLEDMLRRYERAASLIDERDRLEKDIEDIDVRLRQKEGKLKELMSNAWRTVLNNKIKQVRHEIEDKVQHIQTRENQKAIEADTLNKIKQAIQENQCPICIRPLDAEVLRRLTEITNLQTSTIFIEDNDELSELLQIRQVLRKFDANDIFSTVQEITNTIDAYVVDKASNRDRIAEINDHIKDIDHSEVRKVRSEYADLLKEIAILEEAIRSTEEKIKKAKDDIDRIGNEIKREGGSGLGKEQQKSELYNKLYSLFDRGVVDYRERLRERVEKDASELFLRLTSEPDYVGLKINENYGLIILHKDGRAIPVRSAGAEHIVALSLMGALQKNAPLRGPIIMDSPFGRLDEVHTTKVVQTLPIMADQVILLVFESELKPQVARNYLLGKLRSEYKLVRQSARYTTFEKHLEMEYEF